MARDLWYEFRDAISKRDYALASQYLERSPGLIERRNSIGETVMHWLAVENDIEGVAWLHNKGSKVNTKNEFGEPLIFEVAQLGYKELLQWLVEHGADLKATNNEGKNIVQYLEENKKIEMMDYVKQNFTL